MLPFGIFLFIGGAALLLFEKGQDVLLINGLHSPFLDCLFYYGTSLGNGLFYVFIALVLAWKNLRSAIIAFACFSGSGLLVQFLKKTAFSDVLRPSIALAGENLHYVEGVKMLARYSFPSGHSATVFSLCCLLALMAKEKKWGLVCFFLALIGGISRIYLAQHFFIDVYFGAIIGVAVTSLTWCWFEETNALQSFSSKSISAYLRA